MATPRAVLGSTAILAISAGLAVFGFLLDAFTEDGSAVARSFIMLAAITAGKFALMAGRILWRLGALIVFGAACVVATGIVDWGQPEQVDASPEVAETTASAQGVAISPIGPSIPMCARVTGAAQNRNRDEVWIAHQDTVTLDPDWHFNKAEWDEPEADAWSIDLRIGEPPDENHGIEFIAFILNGSDSAFLSDIPLVNNVPVRSEALPSGLDAGIAHARSVRSSVPC